MGDFFVRRGVGVPPAPPDREMGATPPLPSSPPPPHRPCPLPDTWALCRQRTGRGVEGGRGGAGREGRNALGPAKNGRGARVRAPSPSPLFLQPHARHSTRTGMRSGYLSRMRAASACRFSEEERGRRQHWGGEGGAGKKAHRPSLLSLSAGRVRPARGAQGGRGGLAEGRGDTLPPWKPKTPTERVLLLERARAHGGRHGEGERRRGQMKRGGVRGEIEKKGKRESDPPPLVSKTLLSWGGLQHCVCVGLLSVGRVWAAEKKRGGVGGGGGGKHENGTGAGGENEADS